MPLSLAALPTLPVEGELVACILMRRRRPFRCRSAVRRSPFGRSAGGHLADAELLEEQQAVGVGPILCELAVSDAQDVGAGEAGVPADGLGRRPGSRHGSCLALSTARADPPAERLAAVHFGGSGSGQRRGVSDEVL